MLRCGTAEPLSRCLEFRSSSEHHLTSLMFIRDRVPVPAGLLWNTPHPPLSPQRLSLVRGPPPPELGPHCCIWACSLAGAQRGSRWSTGRRNWTSHTSNRQWGGRTELELTARTPGSWVSAPLLRTKRTGRGTWGPSQPQLFLGQHPGNRPQGRERQVLRPCEHTRRPRVSRV